ncbi:hypothetical protein [Laceyella putida]|uniref:Uncharacterized protein n=1 Tax=Laceyella putida TaxID=110101 RepID=A0ABW2RKP5_9BACL
MINPVDLFVDHLLRAEPKPFKQFEHKQFAGVSFFCIQISETSDQQQVETFIQKEAARFIDGTAWQVAFSYVRRSKSGLIYRFQLRVPDEKSFCCGNQCPHCILYRNR